MDVSPWYDDITVLARQPLQFFPNPSTQTPAEMLNASVRFVIYTSAVLFVYTGFNVRIPFLAIGLIAVITLAFKGRRGSLAKLRASYASTAQGSGVQQQVPIEERCTMPTPDNPLMNTLVTEMQKDAKKPPCPAHIVDSQINDYFNKGLYRNIEDIWNKENSQRQFYSMPNGGIPDAKAFRDYVYGQGFTTCKSQPSKCTGYNG